MKQVTINLYSFAELGEKAQQKSIKDHFNFLEEVRTEEDRHIEYDYEYVKEDIEANDYLFFYDGELADCTEYLGAHPKAGTTELRLHGATYVL